MNTEILYAGIGVCFLVSVMGVRGISTYRRNALASVDWAVRPITITRLAIEQKQGHAGRTAYKLCVAYEYVYDGTRYTSTHIAHYFPEWGTDHSFYLRTLDQLRQLRTAFVNPKNHTSAVLIPGNGFGSMVPLPVIYVMILLCPLAGWIALWLAFLRNFKW